MSGSEVTLGHIEAAAAALTGVAQHTPVDHASYLSDLLGVPTYMKLENLQRTGSFKLRGATYRLSRLTDEEKARGVVAASAGNHAQGVAFAAQQLGIDATIFMPLGAPVPKLLATKGYGATVVTDGATVEECLALAAEHAKRTGAMMIHPFDHADVIAGQGTIGLEILKDVPDVETVIVPIGGGGLIAGMAVALKEAGARAGRDIKVIGVQAAATAAFPASLAAGHPVTIERHSTIADGIAVVRPGDVTFPLVQRYVDDVVTVEEDDLAKAVLTVLERTKLVVEPAGAAPVAAILGGHIRPTGPTVVLLSGGNIDPLLMQRIIAHGLVASGRYMTLRIPLPDRPGQLARVADILAEVSANVIEVVHTRHDMGLTINDAVLEVSVETRGPNHQGEVLEALRLAGLSPDVISS
ncbi:threonine ammonia-lyase [Demequina zhanjiangensis]|uniref:L-threonine dehydratase catabolic TdcB n=1 Tax=Demequina zhanjiangensis TaxID=3051659 RepID=A0ABT8G1S2_9MICO|nr:threonine ammonia-lyase [Demequina sp. SYSU T00b26]MDN4473075.1 threonine ammonia-lyase [Demequina sp. SYSU T00b26]